MHDICSEKGHNFIKYVSCSLQISVPSKGSSIFSPIASSNRAPSSSPVSGINRSNEHVKVTDAKITHIQSDIHHPRPGTSSGLPITGTATVQVIASGTAAQAHLAPGPTSKSFSVIPNQNVLKIGSQNVQHSQASVGVNSNAGYSTVTTYRVAPPNSITFSKLMLSIKALLTPRWWAYLILDTPEESLLERGGGGCS